MSINRYKLVEGNLVKDVTGEYVKYEDYKLVEDARSKAVSDAAWAADAAREQAEIDHNRGWN